jgi:Cu/Ag efflux pump CusA
MVVIIALLMLTFRSWRTTALVLVNAPFALVGAVIAIAITGISLSIGTLVGLVTLLGISARNSIMLMSHYEHLVQIEERRWSRVTSLRGAKERLTPILMTAIVTALGVLPLAVGHGEAGQEVEGPMAIVILGGLVSSTVLNLLVLPAVAARYYAAGPARSALSVPLAPDPATSRSGPASRRGP